MMTDHCMIPVLKSTKDYQVFRISPEDTNRLAIVFDSTTADDSLTLRAGDSLLVRPTGIHEIRNPSPKRLYALCFMVPNI